jgi:hypothetical protein
VFALSLIREAVGRGMKTEAPSPTASAPPAARHHRRLVTTGGSSPPAARHHRRLVTTAALVMVMLSSIFGSLSTVSMKEIGVDWARRRTG